MTWSKPINYSRILPLSTHHTKQDTRYQMTERNNRIDPTNQPNECSNRLMSTNHSFRNVSPHVRNYFIKFVEGSDVKFPGPIFMEIYILEKSMKISRFRCPYSSSWKLHTYILEKDTHLHKVFFYPTISWTFTDFWNLWNVVNYQ